METRLFEEEESARLYQRYRVDFVGSRADREIVSFLRQKLPKKVNSTAVDVACGTGFLTRVLAPHFDRVIGVDCSQAQIKVAKENTSSENIEYRLGFGEDLQFLEASSVDAVTVASGIFYLKSEEFFAEVDRVLRPGGVLVVIFEYFERGGPIVVKLTPDVEDEAVIEACQNIMNEVSGLITTMRENMRQAIAAGELPAPKFYEHHCVIVPAERVGDIDTVTGYLNALGNIRAYMKKHPEKEDIRVIYRNRLLSLLSEVSSTPEKVPFSIRSDFQCHMHRKPLSPPAADDAS